MTKLYVRDGTLGIKPGRGRPMTRCTGPSVRDDPERANEYQSRLRICELDDIIRRGGTLKRAG